ncbi:Cell wall synthesis protein kre9 precursor [Coniosporium apollinis]|uniref:Cell wall synthesis protein kre9 n=1 Tax=Coniosporium apollinis TaxID=61459 RepID=A0ABQ9P5M8_9PEZI|nr:Cell wall synthesis protein kre9 precursor [Coniosporium apollinis]
MKTGGRVINYSKRFTLKGVTGVFPAAVITGLKSVTTTDGPATQKDSTGARPAPAEAGDFGVPYLEQTGIMKFAPMQKLPPTKITKKDTKPLFPTTSFQIARTWLPTPKQKTTTTQSRTYKFSSMENTVAAAAHPTDDMERFLARWKD